MKVPFSVYLMEKAKVLNNARSMLHASRRGRPRLRWMDEEPGDLRTMQVTDWGTKVKDRITWRHRGG